MIYFIHFEYTYSLASQIHKSDIEFREGSLKFWLRKEAFIREEASELNTASVYLLALPIYWF